MYKNCADGRIEYTLDYKNAYKKPDVIFIGATKLSNFLFSR